MRLLAAAVLALAAVSAAAVSEAPTAPAPADGEAVAAFAKRVERTAAEAGARVVIVARIGREASTLPAGIEWTHTGLGVYSDVPLADGGSTRGYVFHNLYQRADVPYRSRLVRDTAFDFFAGVTELRAAVLVPVPELQRRLLAAVQDGSFDRLHHDLYSAISNPFDLRYQNCTEHLLDVINAALYGTEDRAVLKARAREWFTPQPVHVESGRLRLASLFVPDVALSDHRGAPATATYGSLARYLRRYDLVASEVVIEH